MTMTLPHDLDDWLPKPQVRTHHRRAAHAEPGALWDQAAGVRLRDTRTMSRLVRWRLPGAKPDQTYWKLFAAYPFTVLDEGEHWSLSGLAGKIWTLDRDYPRLSGREEFCAWDEPRTVRVLFAHWIEPGDDGRSTLVSEARVRATDRRGGLQLRALWLTIGHFERFVGAEALRVAARRAEGG
jgi:hypothetical protein